MSKRSAARRKKDHREKTVRQGVAGLRQPGATRTAVLLGAGASKPFDYPLTRDLLPQIVDWLNHKDFLRFDDESEAIGRRRRQLLREYLMQLLPGKRHRGTSLPLVTSLMSLLDYSLATGQSLLPRRTFNETREARLLVERGILEAIADHEDFTATGETNLERFCQVLTELKQTTPKQPLTVLTTNYDMSADIAAFKCAGVTQDADGYWFEEEVASKIDFGFRWHDPDAERQRLFDRPSNPEVTLLKLHGSTNWLRCPLCDNTYLNPWGPIWHQAFKGRNSYKNQCHCSPTRLQTQIISPSYVREMREPNLHAIWKCALDALRAADRWLIIGYSFPDEDLGVRALFTRAYASRDDRPRIVVVQQSADSIDRYHAFFDSHHLTFCTGGFEAFLDAWRTVKTRSDRPTRSNGRRRRR
ncbi:MAG TPA: SIR2 family protein [Vicinamibacterales bacterium]|nr:SIR2 family protein [Vicinamibacterales bacterium]